MFRSSAPRFPRPLPCLAGLLFLTGCAGFGSTLTPGVATEADARARLGAPTATVQAADGGRVLFYSRQPMGREIHAVRLAPDGRVKAVEQTLTFQRINSELRVGATTRDQARELLGPPHEISRLARQQRDAWEYWTRGLGGEPARLYLSFSDDGVLRDVAQIDERSDPQLRLLHGLLPRAGAGFGAYGGY